MNNYDIAIKEYTKYNEEEIIELYRSVEWMSYVNDPEMLRNSFENSMKVLCAYDGEILVGIVRAVGDGYSILFVQDLLILPEYQRKGIGTKLMKQMATLYPDVYMTVLLSDESEEPISFYKSLGLKINNECSCVAFLKWNKKED